MGRGDHRLFRAFLFPYASFALQRLLSAKREPGRCELQAGDLGFSVAKNVARGR